MGLPAVKLTSVTFNHIRSIFQTIPEKRRWREVSGQGREEGAQMK